jgi:hypothetical protein
MSFIALMFALFIGTLVVIAKGIGGGVKATYGAAKEKVAEPIGGWVVEARPTKWAKDKLNEAEFTARDFRVKRAVKVLEDYNKNK